MFGLHVPSSNLIQMPPLCLLRDLLRERRRRHGFTYDTLARVSGVSRRTIVSLEKGDSTGSLETWYRLSRALHVGFDELFRITASLALTAVSAPAMNAVMTEVSATLSL